MVLHRSWSLLLDLKPGTFHMNLLQEPHARPAVQPRTSCILAEMAFTAALQDGFVMYWSASTSLSSVSLSMGIGFGPAPAL